LSSLSWRLTSCKILAPALLGLGRYQPIALRSGRSDVDESLITGETTPRAVGPGDRVHAGTLSMLGTLTVEATATEGDTLLAEIARLMAAAEQGRGRHVRMADRAARIYAPAVHLLGLATFLGWFTLGYGWERGLTAAIAVLIITCPCALALAVPAVQIAAAHRLFKRGLIVKAPDALERLAEIDTVVFDKTGTLTTGEATLSAPGSVCMGSLRAAAVLATASHHPYARALLRAAAGLPRRGAPHPHVLGAPTCPAWPRIRALYRRGGRGMRHRDRPAPGNLRIGRAHGVREIQLKNVAADAAFDAERILGIARRVSAEAGRHLRKRIQTAAQPVSATQSKKPCVSKVAGDARAVVNPDGRGIQRRCFPHSSRDYPTKCRRPGASEVVGALNRREQ